MKIRYLSDIHLEFIKPNKLEKFIKNIKPNLDEVCVLAGDIGKPFDPNYDIFMKYINKSFKKTFIITGNHEYYNKTKSIDEINNYLTEYFTQFDNISFLNNQFEIYENKCFIGTTLWSKITNPLYEINDIYQIKDFNYIKYNRLNMLNIDFLENTIDKNNDCIIITHHVPLFDLIDIKYKVPKMLPYNQWFYCDMNNLIEKNKNKIKCWFYGHTHTPSFNIINNIYFCCNSIGYPNENLKSNFEKYIEI